MGPRIEWHRWRRSPGAGLSRRLRRLIGECIAECRSPPGGLAVEEGPSDWMAPHNELSGLP